MLAAQARELSSDHGLGLWSVLADGIGTTCEVARGDVSTALVGLRRALDAMRRLRFWFYVPRMLAIAAETHLRIGDFLAGSMAIDEGLALAQTTTSQWYVPELHRIRGELHAGRGAPADTVEASFRSALDAARRQGARSWELRAATSFARWLARRGRDREARSILTPCLQTFDQGFQTNDIRSARLVLDGPVA